MIETQHCWYNLKIDTTNCFLDGYKFPEPRGQYGIWHPLAKDVFNPAWLKYVNEIGLPIYSVMMFYRGPYASTVGAHVDISRPDPFLLTNFAINWVYGGSDSTMSWFETPKEKKKVEFTSANTPYIVWDKSGLTKIESVTLGKQVTLVNTGIPHSIEMGKDPRWAISARTSIRDDYEWDNVVAILRKSQLLIERNDSN